MAARVNKDEFEGKVLKSDIPFWLILFRQLCSMQKDDTCYR